MLYLLICHGMLLVLPLVNPGGVLKGAVPALAGELIDHHRTGVKFWVGNEHHRCSNESYSLGQIVSRSKFCLSSGWRRSLFNGLVYCLNALSQPFECIVPDPR